MSPKDQLPRELYAQRKKFTSRYAWTVFIVVGIMFLCSCAVLVSRGRASYSSIVALVVGGCATMFIIIYTIEWAQAGSHPWKSVDFFCPHCGKFVSGSGSWVCDRCNAVSEFSFLNKCSGCGDVPGAYVCHNCDQLIFLDAHKNIAHPARRPPEPVAGESEAEKKARIAKEREEAKQEREHRVAETKQAIEQTRLDAELIKAMAQREAAAKTATNTGSSERAMLEEKFKKDRETEFALDEIYDREVKRANEEFQNDPERLKDHLAWLQDWKEKHLLEY